MLTLAEVKNKLLEDIHYETKNNREMFCKHFALIARVAGWSWAFQEITIDNVFATYDSIVSTAIDNVMNMSDSDVIGATPFTISISTGRIHINIHYYKKSQQSTISITADIC